MTESKRERELRQLECTINYNEKGHNREGRDRGKMKLKLFSWNVRGANNPIKRNVIRNFIRSQRVDLVCLQETKIQEMSVDCARSFGVGRFFDWKVAEAERVVGGILLFWDKRKLDLVEVETCLFSITCWFKNVEDGFQWAFTGVYGSVERSNREMFWEELGS